MPPPPPSPPLDSRNRSPLPASTPLTFTAALAALRAQAHPNQALLLQRFFKTGPGDYGEGDRFLGIKVPPLRLLARQFSGLDLPPILRLLRRPEHEARLLALFLLVQRFAHASPRDRQTLYRLYLAHTAWINNWDLVDASAPSIVGGYLAGRSPAPLWRLARSTSLWERRIAIVSTFFEIRQNRFDRPLRVSELLLSDPHDLIHKAVGWMLREVGKRDLPTEEGFLAEHYRAMPRTMLRYAIERFPESHRRAYLRGQIG